MACCVPIPPNYRTSWRNGIDSVIRRAREQNICAIAMSLQMKLPSSGRGICCFGCRISVDSRASTAGDPMQANKRQPRLPFNVRRPHLLSAFEFLCTI